MAARRRAHPKERVLPDNMTTTTTWDKESKMARHQRQVRRHQDRACSSAHPRSPW